MPQVGSTTYLFRRSPCGPACAASTVRCLAYGSRLCPSRVPGVYKHLRCDCRARRGRYERSPAITHTDACPLPANTTCTASAAAHAGSLSCPPHPHSPASARAIFLLFPVARRLWSCYCRHTACLVTRATSTVGRWGLGGRILFCALLCAGTATSTAASCGVVHTAPPFGFAQG